MWLLPRIDLPVGLYPRCGITVIVKQCVVAFHQHTHNSRLRDPSVVTISDGLAAVFQPFQTGLDTAQDGPRGL